MGEFADLTSQTTDAAQSAEHPAPRAQTVPSNTPGHQERSGHIPILMAEVLDGLSIKPGGYYLDATVGGGGHAAAILEASGPMGRLLGLDRDPEAATRAAMHLKPFGDRALVIPTSYVHLTAALQHAGFPPLDGVLFDLGFSSWQVDDPKRGFAFRTDGPLDMRFDPTSDDPPASVLVNQLAEAELADLLRRYGEDPRSRRIAQAIVTARPIRSTEHLADVIVTAVGRARGERLHPATRTFQALRIAVNHELEGITEVLPQAVAVLRPGGRLAVITFHSLEDRIVKHFLKQEERGCICPPKTPICTCGHVPTLQNITRKPVIPSAEEIAANPRSRSAKLRVAEKL
ncbi:MAG: 16S rRNA (cytosine(1402)-N(4))-methyltransferase RsmH [Anaerolineae bacterium]|nr:16S rRNA (cytosine(1402)-N(4))-methyltransferase RsmH [Anaerolineae bacterium]